MILVDMVIIGQNLFGLKQHFYAHIIYSNFNDMFNIQCLNLMPICRL